MSRTYKDMIKLLPKLEPFKINTVTGTIDSLFALVDNIFKPAYIIKSYDTVIAFCFLPCKDKTIYINVDKYSHTTSRQQGIIKRAFWDSNFKVVKMSSTELVNKFNINSNYFKRYLHTRY